jgi:hypothetical protein
MSFNTRESIPWKIKFIFQGGGDPGVGLHAGAGVAHPVPPLPTLPPTKSQAGGGTQWWTWPTNQWTRRHNKIDNSMMSPPPTF